MVRRPIDYVFEGKDEVFLGTWLGQKRGVFGEMVQNLSRAEMGHITTIATEGQR